VESGVGSFMCSALQNTHFNLLVLFIAAANRFENSVQHNIGVCMGDCRTFFLIGVTGEKILFINLISRYLKIF
jgi:uncharacterized protein with PIN domain